MSGGKGASNYTILVSPIIDNTVGRPHPLSNLAPPKHAL